MPEIDGTVIVTGAASGIGRAVADVLVDDGVTVRRLDLQEGDGIEPFDVTDEAAWSALDGRDVVGVVHAAGIRRMGRLDQTDPDRFREVIEVNVTGTFLALRWAGVVSRRRRPGPEGPDRPLSVVTLSSAVVDRLPAEQIAYNASKAAVIAATRSAAIELAPMGARANVLAPGSILTPMTQEGWDDPEHAAQMTAQIPARRAGRADEIARIARFLLTDASSYLNGAVITADGGWTL